MKKDLLNLQSQRDLMIKMNGIRPALITIFMVWYGTAFSQLKITNLDLNYKYNNNAGVSGEVRCSKKETDATLLIKLDKVLDSLKRYTLSYSLVNSLDEEITTRTTLNTISSYFQYEDGVSSYYGIKTWVGQANYFVLWLTDTVERIHYPIVKAISQNLESDELILLQREFNAPVIRSYIKVNSDYRISSLGRNSGNVEINYYDHHFLPAKPPMTKASDSVKVRFERDKKFALQLNDTISFIDKGLYYLSIEGAEHGQSIVVKEEQFPRAASFDELVEALRYLATEEEYLKMTTSFDKKEYFDKFWLNNTKSEEKARDAVREYFRRVREANGYFTSYKEGWKTDRGMIYIIFGPPNRVFLREEGEMWIYDKTFELPRIVFTFEQIDTAFTNNHFVLLRKAEYQNLWFRTVDLWRSGKKEY